jgi:heme A synthase
MISVLVIAFGLVLGLGGAVEWLRSPPISAHPFAQILFVAAVALVAAGSLARKEPSPRLTFPALLFVVVLTLLGSAFVGIAAGLAVVFALLPSVAVMAILAPIVLAWLALDPGSRPATHEPAEPMRLPTHPRVPHHV